ncbi:MAG: hypothetical protein IIC26_06140 [Chloroflexi bacterium]|nr:hypothetical protein [Chloroflexota bacterium]
MANRRAQGRGRLPRAVRSWKAIAGLAVVAVAVIAGVAIWLAVGSSSEPPGPPKAAIVDQLSLTFPNEDFIRNSTATLEQAGYVVDYFPGEEVNVEFYRQLPTHDYDVILFRVHADRLQATLNGREIDEVILFTGEPYSERKYLEERSTARLTIARYYEGGDPYFGIAADFIEDTMVGRFDETKIIMMGCEGLLSDRTAQAFINKGASTYISWDETVSASHTDAASERLLELLLLEGQTPTEAAAQTMEELGPDPTYGSKLLAYPSEG